MVFLFTQLKSRSDNKVFSTINGRMCFVFYGNNKVGLKPDPFPDIEREVPESLFSVGLWFLCV